MVQRENKEYLVRNPSRKLNPGENIKVKITVKYDASEPAPQMVGFRLNARVVCPENGILDPNAKPVAPPQLTTT